LDQLVVNLDHKKYLVRVQAAEKLGVYGETAKPVLERALKANPSLEKKIRLQKLLAQLAERPHPELLRLVRGIEVLELVGTTQAQAVLQKLAQGMPSFGRTEDAQAALRRLRSRG